MKSIISKKNAFYLFIIILCTIPITSNAQYWMEKYGYLENFYSISDSTEWWFNQDTSRIGNGAYGYKSFARWKTFLNSRVDENGSLKTYSSAYANAIDQIRARSNNTIGKSWESIGPNDNTMNSGKAYLGIVTSMKVLDNNADTIYAGGGTGGLFVTYNGGENWHCLTETYGVTGVEAIEVDPDHHNIIYIGTGFFTWGREYSVGVMKSTDYGETWNSTDLDSDRLHGKNYVISDMCIDPDNPSTLMAIANLENASNGKGTYLMKTINGGLTWDSILPSQYYHDEFKKLEIDPSGFGSFYLSGTKVLKFVENQDGTYTWIDLTPNLQLGTATLIRATTAINPIDNNKIIVVLEKQLADYSKVIDFYYSTDYGNSFSLLTTYPSTINTSNYFKMEVEWSRQNSNYFYLGGTYFARYEIASDNTLITHNFDNTTYHKDIRHLELHTKNNSGSSTQSEHKIFIGNDGGVSSCDDNITSISFSDMTNIGLNITQYYGIGIPTDGSKKIIGGTQDGNFEKYNEGVWTHNVALGDAGEVVFNHRNSDTAYIVTFMVFDYFYKTTNGGLTWKYQGNWSLPNRRNDAPFEMSNVNPQVLLIGGKNVWKSVDGGENFMQISFENDNTVSRLKTLRFAPSDNQVIYAAYDMYIWTGQKRLIRSLDGGSTWTDITPREININLSGAGIFDLAVDPENPYVFYITLDRNKDGHKVYKGEGSTSVTWTNISEGITNLPVNCIELLKGSTIDEMFIGTDDGVYYRNSTLDHWVPFGTALPIVSVSDLEIDYVNNELIAATFGRGVYKTDLCGALPETDDIVIENSQTWIDKRVPKNLIINAGAELIIKGTVWMNEGYSITVRKGAKLTIEGGTITSSCPSTFWNGIVVNGVKDLPQNPINQGWVSIKNGTIKNAKIGIHSINSTAYPSTGGGMITANRATFVNNLVAIQMEKYYSNNIANFTLCNFLTDENFIQGAEFENFVRLNEVSNIRFYGCSFKNTSTTEPIGTGIGIYGNWSHFIVDGYCKAFSQSICTEYQNSRFENLVYGIYNWGTLGGKTFSVMHTDFYFNDCGLFASSTYNATIKENTYTVIQKGEKKSGLYLDFCNGFVVEDNTFWYPYGTIPEVGTRGIVVNNSGELENIIYRNFFKALEFGICAQDINRNKDGSSGLRIKCNKFDFTQYDIAITRSQQVPGYGIAFAQGTSGTCIDPAGNLFSNPTNYTGYWGIVNDCESIIYTHHNPISEPKVKPSNYTQASVTLNPTQIPYSPECCPEHNSGGGGSIDQVFLDQKSMADSIQSELSLLIDDGNTSNKLFIVSTALEEENVEIHNDLLNTSPYVSDTVIQSVILKEDVFNNAMVRDVMVANPKSVKSETIIDNLNNRIELMPEFMLDEILEGLDSLSMRELLEIKMQIGNSNYTYGFNRLLAESLNDSLNSIENMSYLLELDSTFPSKCKKAWIILEAGDTLQAMNYLDSINLANQLTAAQSLELTEQRAFMEWLSDADDIDSTKLFVLNYFMASPSAYVSSSARGLLVANNLMQYSEPYLVPDFTKNTEVKKGRKDQLKFSLYVKVYPNPSKDYITIEYNLNNKNSQAYILIVDPSGRTIRSISVSKLQDLMLFDTSSLKSGNYFVQLVQGGKLLTSSRFTIIK